MLGSLQECCLLAMALGLIKGSLPPNSLMPSMASFIHPAMTSSQPALSWHALQVAQSPELTWLCLSSAATLMSAPVTVQAHNHTTSHGSPCRRANVLAL